MEYAPIQPLDIKPDAIIDFDLFLYFPVRQNYLLYRRKGYALESADLQRFANSKASGFYVRKDEYQIFVNYVSKTLCQLIKSRNSDERSVALNAMSKNLLIGTFTNASTDLIETLIENLNDITAQVVEAAFKNSKMPHSAYVNIARLAKNGTSFQKHPINVSSFALLIAIGLGHSSEQLIAELAMAAVLHDLGLALLPNDLAIKAHYYSVLPEAEQEQVRKHPLLTLEVIKRNKLKVSELTEILIRDHHERYDGQGYPRKIKGATINEMTMILNFADSLDASLWTLSKESEIRPNGVVKELLLRYGAEKAMQPQLLKKIASLLGAGGESKDH